MTEWTRACRVDEIPASGMKQVTTEDGTPVLVLTNDGEYHACQAMCPHMDTPLEEGMFDGSTLTCHLHLWQWDIDSGDPKGLAESPLPVYEVKREGDALFVRLA